MDINEEISQLKHIARLAAENSRHHRFTWGNKTFGSLQHLLKDHAKSNGMEVGNLAIDCIAYNAQSEIGII
jgi:hypothetical protein